MVERLRSRTHSTLRQWPIVLLRVYTGVFFAWHGLGKLWRGNFADGMQGFLNSQADNTFGFYQPFIEFVVLPNREIFAVLVAVGELAVGLLLIVGLATRYAAVAGAILVLNFWFAKGQGFFDGSNHDVVWLVIFVVLAAIPAGRVAGLDDGLSDKMPFLR